MSDIHFTLKRDMERLMKFPSYIVDNIGWSLDKSIEDWDCIDIKDGRIIEINIEYQDIGNEEIKAICKVLPQGLQELNVYDNNIGPEGIKAMVLPPGLKKLNIANNAIGPEGIKKLVLPLGLQQLNLYSNNIGDKGIAELILPPGLKILNLGGNNICNKGLERLILPQGLKKLDLGDNNIDKEGIIKLKLPLGLIEINLIKNNICTEGVKRLILPPGLKTLHLSLNSIDEESAKRLILPPALQHLYIRNLFSNETHLIQYAKSVKGIKRYIPIKWYYEKTVQKEICRGLLFGVTTDQIFTFLQKIHGSKNIRRNIFEYFNVLLE